MAPKRIVVIGGDAAGTSAAAIAKRRAGAAFEVIVLERSGWTSYSACGIPYWIGGEVAGPDELIARTPEEHRRRGIDLRTHTEAIAIDPDAGTVRARAEDGIEFSIGYDELVLATGAEPAKPQLPGVDSAGIQLVHSLDDGIRVLDDLTRANPRRAVVVGGGYVGVEMAEASMHKGISTTLITRSATPMSSLDAELGEKVREAMEGQGIDVAVSSPARGFTSDGGRVTGVETDSCTYPADIVFLGVGVRARSALAAEAGLATGVGGAIRVDSRMRADADRHIWAAGDCVETYHRISRQPVHVPLGTHANKQGMVVGRNLCGEDVEFPGVLGTAITKVGDTEVARTGLGEAEAGANGYDPAAITIETTTRSGYYPGADPMMIKLIADRQTRMLLGIQIVGGQTAAKRVDTVATALWAGLSIDELMFADLSYAPPFSSVWEPVQIAARALVSQLAANA